MSSWSTVLVACTLFVGIAAASSIIFPDSYDRLSSKTDSNASTNDLCVTPACVHAASRILKDMNPGVEPCDDFYEFVCGNYSQSVPSSDTFAYGLPAFESLIEVNSRMQQIVQDIDESKAPAPFARLKTRYNECMRDAWKNTSDSSVKVAQQKRQDFVNQWRMNFRYQIWPSTEFNYELLSRYLMKVYGRLDETLSQTGIYELSFREPPIASSYFKDGMSNEVVQYYSKYLEDLITHLGAVNYELAAYVRDVINFEIELAQITFPESENYDVKDQYTRTTFGELREEFPGLSLIPSFMVRADAPVQMRMNSDLLGKLEKLILRTPKKTLADWQSSRWLAENINRLGPDVIHKNNMLKRTLYGFIKTEYKWQQCVNEVRSSSRFLMDVLYYGQYLSDLDVKDTGEMFISIQEELVKLVQKADWLKASVKEHVIEKVKKIKSTIGVYEEFMLDKTSGPRPTDVKLSDGLLARNRANVSKLLEQFNKLSKSQQSSPDYGFVEWVAIFIFKWNFIRIGALGYTDNYYNAHSLKALNYAGIGSLIGHELTHSIDDYDRHFNKDGNLQPYWDSESNHTYVKNTQCLVNRYKRYGSDELGVRLKSFMTRNEDIADVVGNKVAYLAYEKLMKNKREPKLPGLKYSPKQLFWITVASKDCTRYRPPTMRSLIYEQNHSFGSIRVNVPLSNEPAFAQDFQCPVGSKMNPVEKCVIW